MPKACRNAKLDNILILITYLTGADAVFLITPYCNITQGEYKELPTDMFATHLVYWVTKGL